MRNLFADGQFLWLGLVAIINTVISLYYYFKIVKAMYFMENEAIETKSCCPYLYWIIIIFSAQNIMFYLYWPTLWNLLESIVKSMGII